MCHHLKGGTSSSVHFGLRTDGCQSCLNSTSQIPNYQNRDENRKSTPFQSNALQHTLPVSTVSNGQSWINTSLLQVRFGPAMPPGVHIVALCSFKERIYAVSQYP